MQCPHLRSAFSQLSAVQKRNPKTMKPNETLTPHIFLAFPTLVAAAHEGLEGHCAALWVSRPTQATGTCQRILCPRVLPTWLPQGKHVLLPGGLQNARSQGKVQTVGEGLWGSFHVIPCTAQPHSSTTFPMAEPDPRWEPHCPGPQPYLGVRDLVLRGSPWHAAAWGFAGSQQGMRGEVSVPTSRCSCARQCSQLLPAPGQGTGGYCHQAGAAPAPAAMSSCSQEVPIAYFYHVFVFKCKDSAQVEWAPRFYCAF